MDRLYNALQRPSFSRAAQVVHGNRQLSDAASLTHNTQQLSNIIPSRVRNGMYFGCGKRYSDYVSA